MEEGSQNAKEKLHFGYLVVIALVLTSFIPLSLGLSCAGIFYPAVSASLGVDAGLLGYYTSFLWGSALVFLPMMGKLLNNKDARLCLTGAVVVMIAGFVVLAFTQHIVQFFIGAVLEGIGVGMLLFLAPSTLINRWFAKRAGFFLGVCMAFTGVGGVVWSTVGGVLINALGWSATYLVFAVLCACTIPATLFLVASRPQDKGMQPYGYEPGETEQAPADASPTELAEQESGITASQAFRMPVFYCIALMCFLLNFGMYVYFMIPSYASTLELSVALPLLGATASSVAMAGQTVSKLAFGAIGDKQPHACVIVGIVLGAAGVAMLGLLSGSAPAFYVAAFIYGVYYGLTNVMTPILTRISFGNRDYAKIYSRISMAASIGSMVSGFVWGTTIAATHSYMPMFVGVIVLMAITAAMVLVIRRMQVGKAAL